MIIKRTYDKIGFKKRKSGKCPVCGKRSVRTEEFYQTINPWNIKTPDEIYKEEKLKAEKWEKEPVFHEKCERFKKG